MEHYQQTFWQVKTFFSFVPRITKLHPFTACEKGGTQDEGQRVNQAHQQRGAFLWKVPTPQGDGISGTVMPDEHDTALNHLEAG